MFETEIPIDIGWHSKAVIGRHDSLNRRTPEICLDFLDAHTYGVSRRHAVLLWRNDALHIMDLGSSNGTSVNGRRLNLGQLYRLADGDTIQVGRVQLRLRFDPSRNYPPMFTAKVVTD